MRADQVVNMMSDIDTEAETDMESVCNESVSDDSESDDIGDDCHADSDSSRCSSSDLFDNRSGSSACRGGRGRGRGYRGRGRGALRVKDRRSIKRQT